MSRIDRMMIECLVYDHYFLRYWSISLPSYSKVKSYPFSLSKEVFKQPLLAAQRATLVAGPKSPTQPPQQTWSTFSPHFTEQFFNFVLQLSSHFLASAGHLSLIQISNSSNVWALASPRMAAAKNNFMLDPDRLLIINPNTLSNLYSWNSIYTIIIMLFLPYHYIPNDRKRYRCMNFGP